jgi:hypothetical protein
MKTDAFSDFPIHAPQLANLRSLKLKALDEVLHSGDVTEKEQANDLVKQIRKDVMGIVNARADQLIDAIIHPPPVPEGMQQPDYTHLSEASVPAVIGRSVKLYALKAILSNLAAYIESEEKAIGELDTLTQ